MQKILAVFFIFFATILSADDIKKFTILKVIDGDTILINVDDIPDVFGKEVAVRIRGVDTPEMRTKNPKEKELALKAKDRLGFLLRGKVEIKNASRDKYFRLLADVYVDGQSVAEILIREGYARPYDGGKKEKW